MEKELNIAAILKDKPTEIKLWSDTFGVVSLLATHSDSFDVKHIGNNLSWRYYSDGSLMGYKGNLCIFPSRNMRDWSKFAWKKGDVLCCDFGKFCIFDKWANDQYTEFYGRYPSPTYSKEGDKFDTENWSGGFEGVVGTTFIKKIEEHYGGKLNLETLEIEKPKPEFKDGDIVYLNTKNGLEYVFAYDANKAMTTSYIVAYCITLEEFAHIETQYICRDDVINSIHLATYLEKQQLFDALAKENKVWNPDTKKIEDLPKKCEFKPFDKVLVRDLITAKWRPAFFVRMREEDDPEYIYKCLSFETAESCGFRFCIPYNDSTAHLLGTTDEWKGGER